MKKTSYDLERTLAAKHNRYDFERLRSPDSLITQGGGFLPSLTEIDPVVLEKKFLISHRIFTFFATVSSWKKTLTFN